MRYFIDKGGNINDGCWFFQNTGNLHYVYWPCDGEPSEIEKSDFSLEELESPESKFEEVTYNELISILKREFTQ